MSTAIVPLRSLIDQASPPEGSPKELIAEHAALVEKANGHQKNVERVAQRKREFSASLDNGETPETGSGVLTFDAEQIRDLDLQLLQDELKIRTEVEPFLGRAAAAISDASRAADKALSDCKAELIAAYVEMGHDDPALKPLSPCRVLPMFWQSHPRYRALLEAQRTASGRSDARLVARNREAIVSLRTQIRESGKKLAGI